MVTENRPNMDTEPTRVPDLNGPQNNAARRGRLPLSERIGEAAHVIVGRLGERPGPPPKHVGPPPVAAEPPGLAPVPASEARP
ncbi:hypothetical protein [Nocardia amikacinitolerans]|uniref:hypothetical protein n=1 Tax=Nocardia amikacinitolerans TaxID=756689 RepID=UPI0020A4D258|nr:hypothetical protein [Nocardia amikacinitolerans]MCP2281077.1 hypothetical protein [Nocardia amikacinitolerans]